MKRMLFYLLLMLSLTTRAQNKKYDLRVTGGYALNLRAINQTSHYNRVSYWPYAINADINLSRRVWIGFGYMYQEFENYSFRKKGSKSYANSRLRLQVDLYNSEFFQVYACYAAGFTYDGEGYGYPRYQLQGLGGARYHFNESFSANLEAGFGYPYFAMAGLSYKLNIKESIKQIKQP